MSTETLWVCLLRRSGPMRLLQMVWFFPGVSTVGFCVACGGCCGARHTERREHRIANRAACPRRHCVSVLLLTCGPLSPALYLAAAASGWLSKCVDLTEVSLYPYVFPTLVFAVRAAACSHLVVYPVVRPQEMKRMQCRHAAVRHVCCMFLRESAPGFGLSLLLSGCCACPVDGGCSCLCTSSLVCCVVCVRAAQGAVVVVVVHR